MSCFSSSVGTAHCVQEVGPCARSNEVAAGGRGRHLQYSAAGKRHAILLVDKCATDARKTPRPPRTAADKTLIQEQQQVSRGITGHAVARAQEHVRIAGAV